RARWRESGNRLANSASRAPARRAPSSASQLRLASRRLSRVSLRCSGCETNSPPRGMCATRSQPRLAFTNMEALSPTKPGTQDREIDAVSTAHFEDALLRAQDSGFGPVVKRLALIVAAMRGCSKADVRRAGRHGAERKLTRILEFRSRQGTKQSPR